jgi:hypothetical protein
VNEGRIEIGSHVSKKKLPLTFRKSSTIVADSRSGQVSCVQKHRIDGGIYYFCTQGVNKRSCATLVLTLGMALLLFKYGARAFQRSGGAFQQAADRNSRWFSLVIPRVSN